MFKLYDYYCHGIDENWEHIADGNVFETVEKARHWAEDNEFPHYEIILIKTDAIIEEV